MRLSNISKVTGTGAAVLESRLTPLLGGAWFHSGKQKTLVSGAYHTQRQIAPYCQSRFGDVATLNGDTSIFAFYLNEAMPAVDSITLNHDSGTHATETLNFAFYNAGADFLPTTKIANSDASISLVSTGIKTINFSPKPALPAGLVWGFLVCSTVNTGTVNPALVCAFAGAVDMYQSLFGANLQSGEQLLQYRGCSGIFRYSFNTANGGAMVSLPSTVAGFDFNRQVTHSGGFACGVPFVVITGT